MPEHDVTKAQLPRGTTSRNTHARLIAHAAQWAPTYYARLGITVLSYLTEARVGRCDERPDYLGYLSDGSTCMIEVKASTTDALRNQVKPWLGPAGVGNYRWLYISYAAILPATLLPPGWGLVIHGKGGESRIVRHASWQPANRQHEAALLRAA